MIDRDEAHRRLDNLLDDLERLRSANDPNLWRMPSGKL